MYDGTIGADITAAQSIPAGSVDKGTPPLESNPLEISVHPSKWIRSR
jgi:hypothetical protein